MAYYVYLIKTIKPFKHKTYVGYTNNLNKRLLAHNKGKGAKFTRGRKWKLIYYEILKNKSAALKRENEIKKNHKLRKTIKINNKKEILL
jgi:putative endonuclease